MLDLMRQSIKSLGRSARSFWTPLLLIVSTRMLLAIASGAQPVPQLINYQGRLANSDGSPFPTADYQLSIRIYDAATNGVLVLGSAGI